eukprot:TRINITY_DN5624_c0_g1_i1.p1 TRINITY_DN5624_c0_g1~~TRINITY_DN5624_c0_g1_i1.p1  ORF type:complete len:339 (+),score=60.95 TRINITY_DN5624_c0_g1_i1:55-1071(+)
MAEKIRKQVEFYFSDSNYPRDKFLRGEAAKDADNWVPISVLLTFKRLAQLTTDVSAIAGAVQESNVCEVSKEGDRIRRRGDLPDVDDSVSRTIYAKGFADDFEIEVAQGVFAQYGQVLSVRKRYAADKKFKGSVFVEFATPQEAQNAAAATTSVGDAQLLTLMKKAYLDQKREERLAKKADARNKARSAGGDASEAKEAAGPADEAMAEIEMVPNTVLHVSNVGEGAQREDLKAIFENFSIAYIDFQREVVEGHIRFKTAENATSALKYAEETKPQVKGKEIKVELIQGEAEKKYWADLAESRTARFAMKRERDRGGKRGGFKRGGRGGRGGKRGRTR